VGLIVLSIAIPILLQYSYSMQYQYFDFIREYCNTNTTNSIANTIGSIANTIAILPILDLAMKKNLPKKF
jgi:uncharacterized membrane protein YkgB